MPERVHKRLDAGEDVLATASTQRPSLKYGGSVGFEPSIKSKKRKRDASHIGLSNGESRVRERSPQQTTQNLPQATVDKSTITPQDDQKARQKMTYAQKRELIASKMNADANPVVSKTAGNIASSLRDRAKVLWPIRKALPIWSHSLEIREGLRKKDIMLLVGETGSGKSTQVPQILLNEAWCKPRFLSHNRKIGGCIAVTEPRRVAAISLARRVAEETGSPLGASSPASTVGYSVRFDNSTSASTNIKFLTEGMMLQEMLRDPWLKQYSAVVVDEVHERGVNVDLVLGFLRDMAKNGYKGREGVALKVVVMSATAEMESLQNFFEEAKGEETNEINGRTSEAFYGENDLRKQEESEWSGISTSDEEEDKKMAQNTDAKPQPSAPNRTPGTALPDRSKKTVKVTNGIQPHVSHHGPVEQEVHSHVATCHIEGRQYPVQINYLPKPTQDIVEASLRTIFQIHRKEPMPGDILVFLTGQETVESLESLVREYAQGMGPELPKLLVLPLFAALSQEAQQRIFQPAPLKTRKVIVATNIAETSVTVPGVRFVIDCGKAKTKHFRTRIGLESLLVKPISKSAAIQRKGRAGREAPGQCYRLYTEEGYLTFQESNTPEILRCDLSHPILTMKARGIDEVLNFPFMNQPPREAMEKALLQLYQLGALTDSGFISSIGRQIAKFPLTVSLGRALIAAAEADCVAEVIDIIACLSVENVFQNLNSEEQKAEAESARRELYNRDGDHLTLLATVHGYAAENTDRRAWADRHFVSHRAMRAVMDVRKQLRAQCQTLETLPKDEPVVGDAVRISPEKATAVLKSFLKGFVLSTARLCPDGRYKTVVGNQTVAIHPSSGLFGKKVEAIMYNEFVYTTKAFARGVSAVQMDWIGEAVEA